MKKSFALSLALLTFVLAACGQPTAPRTQLEDNLWLLSSIKGQPVIDGEEFYGGDGEYPAGLFIHFEGEVFRGFSGCNMYGGDYLATDTKLTLEVGEYRRSCLPAMLDQRRRYFTAFGEVEQYKISDGTLALMNAKGQTVLVYHD